MLSMFVFSLALTFLVLVLLFSTIYAAYALIMIAIGIGAVIRRNIQWRPTNNSQTSLSLRGES